MKETSIIKVKLPLDWMINKKAGCQEETFHTRGVLQRLRQLPSLHFLWRGWHRRSRFTLNLRPLWRKLDLAVFWPRGSSLIAPYWVWATHCRAQPRRNFHRGFEGGPHPCNRQEFLYVASTLQRLKSFRQTDGVSSYFSSLLSGGVKRCRGSSDQVK